MEHRFLNVSSSMGLALVLGLICVMPAALAADKGGNYRDEARGGPDEVPLIANKVCHVVCPTGATIVCSISFPLFSLFSFFFLALFLFFLFFLSFILSFVHSLTH